MAARRIRGEVRNRKVTVFTRPPELNVILEDQAQKQCQDHDNYQAQTKDGESDCNYAKENGHGSQCDSQRLEDRAETEKRPSIKGVNPYFGEIQDQTPRRLRTVSDGSEYIDSLPAQYTNTNGRLRTDSIAYWSPPIIAPVDVKDSLLSLKQYAAKLNLPTRRPSYLTWKQEHFGSGDTPLVTLSRRKIDADDVTWSRERTQKIDDMLVTIRKDLALREEDQALAERLMTLRLNIHDVKISRYHQANRDLLEEAMFNEERDELDDVGDLPPRLFSPALKQYGLTRMNVQTRRFSVF